MSGSTDNLAGKLETRVACLVLFGAVVVSPDKLLGQVQNDIVEAQVCCSGAELGRNPASAFDGQSRFIVAWSRPRDINNNIHSDLLVQRYLANSAVDSVRALLSDTMADESHDFPSIAIAADERATVGWLGWKQDELTADLRTVLAVSFDYDDVFTAPQQRPPPLGEGRGDAEPSAGTSDFQTDIEAFAWSRKLTTTDPNRGLLYGLSPLASQIIRDRDG